MVYQIPSESPAYYKKNILISFFLDRLYIYIAALLSLLYMHMYFYLYLFHYYAGVLFLSHLVVTCHSHTGITGELID